jgi:hypothetical protein
LSEAVKQNYSDIKRVDAEVDKVKQVVCALYERFIDLQSPKKQESHELNPGKRRKVIGWTAAAILISALIALTVVHVNWAYFAPAPSDHPILNPLPEKDERSMLLELYDSLQATDTRWNFTAHHCFWKGISCNSTTGHVIAIILPFFAIEFGLPGPSIPASIGNFTELQHLDLSLNNIISTIPESIRNLKNLVSLKLNLNMLTGSVPDLRGLPKLQLVDLSNNYVTGSLATLMQLPALETLLMKRNPINSELPQTISKTLVQVDLASCGLYGAIPEAWTTTNLKSLDVRQNNLSGSVPCFGERVTALYASKNLLDGEFCGSSLLSIAELDLSFNNLTKTFDLPNANISSMSVLSIADNKFTSFLPSKADPSTSVPHQCNAAFNAFKCPIPSWSERCGAKCT